MVQRDNDEQESTVDATASEEASEAAELDRDGLLAALEAARAEAATFKDKYLREYAERENFRKRQERILSDRIRHERRDVLASVLDVVDTLDRALRFEEQMDREAMGQTLRMVVWQLNELLKAQGITPVGTVGEPFDPHVHDAVEAVASDDYPEGTIVEEVRKGYRMGEDTFRPARVIVSQGPTG